MPPFVTPTLIANWLDAFIQVATKCVESKAATETLAVVAALVEDPGLLFAPQVSVAPEIEQTFVTTAATPVSENATTTWVESRAAILILPCRA